MHLQMKKKKMKIQILFSLNIYYKQVFLFKKSNLFVDCLFYSTYFIIHRPKILFKYSKKMAVILSFAILSM